MAIRKYTLQTTQDHQGKRLDQVLAEWLPVALGQPVSKAKARKLVVAGAIYLNGARVRIASKELKANARVEAQVDLVKLNADGRGQDQPFAMEAGHVLFEDAYLIAVNKPPGLPTQPTLDEARDNLFAAVKKFLARRDGGQPYVGLHHRLDRDTSGVVLFTKDPKANAGVAELFAGHLARKTYFALAPRPAKLPAATWTVKNHLGRAPGPGKAARFTAVRAGGDFAHTEFRLLETLAGGLWIEAQPRTGRTHQIRVHLAEAGLPIIGDRTYGANGDRAYGPRFSGAAPGGPRLMLHAVNLTFPHPITKVETSIQSPLPEDFDSCLQTLRKGRSFQ